MMSGYTFALVPMFVVGAIGFAIGVLVAGQGFIRAELNRAQGRRELGLLDRQRFSGKRSEAERWALWVGDAILTESTTFDATSPEAALRDYLDGYAKTLRCWRVENSQTREAFGLCLAVDSEGALDRIARDRGYEQGFEYAASVGGFVAPDAIVATLLEE